MRVVWKDSTAKDTYKPLKYRKHYATKHKGGGWVIDIPGDNNVYKNHYCALNAIDAALGETGRKKEEKRIRYGIQIIGQRDE